MVSPEFTLALVVVDSYSVPVRTGIGLV